MMKKIVSVLLSALLLCSLFAVCASAADTPSFVLSDAQGAVGETVSVELRLNNNPGITSLQVKVAYSPEDLELVNISNGGLFDNPISKSSVEKNPAIISWYATDSENKSESGVLATLSFEVKEGAKDSVVMLSYDEDDIFNNSMENVSFDTSTATVKVVEAQTEPDPEETTAPQDTTAPIETTPQSTTAPQETTVPQPAFRSLYYLPSAEQEEAGFNYVLGIEDKDGVWHEYKLTATTMKKNGVTVYAATIPEEITPSEIKYQVYNGDEWVSQVSKTVSGIDDIADVVVNSVGTETGINDFKPDSAPAAKLSKTSAKVNAGKAFTLKVTNGKVKSWTSSKKAVATVTKSGKVTALKKGSAKITATLTNGKKLACNVTVKTNPTIKIGSKAFKSKTTYTVKKGKSLTVKITGKASSVNNAYATSKKSIAKITTKKKTVSSVKLKGLKKGSAVITLKVNGVAFKIKIKVK